MQLNIFRDRDLFLPNLGGQAAFLDDYEHRCVAFVGGWGSGKTWAGARKLVNLHVINGSDGNGKLTGVKGLTIAPTYQLALTVNVPEIGRALTEVGLKFTFSGDGRQFCFTVPELSTARQPSQILVRSAERADRLAGFEVGHLWGDEAGRWRYDPMDIIGDTMLQAEGRLRAPGARFTQALYTFTHEGDCTRVYERFEMGAAGDASMAVYRATTDDNPLMREYARHKRLTLPPALAAQYIDGRAMSLRGSAVYAAFDPAKHVDAGLVLSNDLPLHLSLDFNIDPGMHGVLGQHLASEQVLTAVHEIHEPRMDVRRLLAALRELTEREYGGWRWPTLAVYGDASGRGKGAGTGDSCWDIVREGLRHAGVKFTLNVPRANPTVADRVNAVNCALWGLDARVRYRIHPRCKLLLRDLREMKWTDGELDKRVRALSHASDAEGYRVVELLPIRRFERTSRIGSVGFSG
jgi:hypothetical protein